jgi:hypothetical protein
MLRIFSFLSLLEPFCFGLLIKAFLGSFSVKGCGNGSFLFWIVHLCLETFLGCFWLVVFVFEQFLADFSVGLHIFCFGFYWLCGGRAKG